jgi:hypothetical protein
MVRKVTIRLRPGRDDDLITALDAIPAGAREARLREALRWHFVPGGFQDLADAVRHLIAVGIPRVPAASIPPEASPPAADRLAATAQVLATVMAEFGWDEE